VSSDPVHVRPATPDDAAVIHGFVCELAAYEREPDAVRATPESLRAQLASCRPPFECLIAELDGEPAGLALFFHNYSSWRGRAGLFLEDLFVPERFRRRGIGLRLLIELARIARARGCARMEWAVLDWNRPAIDFYASLGAEPLGEWTLFRLSDAALERLAARQVRR
jgi:GNAT superfamily N-acetyltransferase